MKIDNKKILNIVTLCILLIVPFLKFFSMNLQMFGLMQNYDNINPANVLYIAVPILMFIYIKDIISKKRRLDIFDYIFYALIVAGGISIVFSLDKSLAIFGKEFRHEGFLSVLSYYLLFINYKVNGTKDDIKKFIRILIVIGIINAIYAILQLYTSLPFILRYYEYDIYNMSSGLCGNPNFLGSLIVTVLSIVTCRFLIEENCKFKNILIIVLLFTTLICAQSTGPFLTYLIVILFLLLFLDKKKVVINKNALLLIVILIPLYISIQFINTNFINTNFINTRNEFSADGIRETIKSGGNGRLKIWKNSLDIVKDNFIAGVGFDNFYLAYPNPKIEEGLSFSITTNSISKQRGTYLVIDNAHNVYLHTLSSTGILGLIPYLALLLLTFIKGLKSKNKLVFILMGGFFAYSVQAFANISVVWVAPIYYIIIGLILSVKE